MTFRLKGKVLKMTVVLNPAEVVGVIVPKGQPRFPVSIEAGGTVLRCDLNAKPMRRCVAVVTEAGADAVSVILQGKLVDDTVEDAGITATPRTPKPQAEAGEASQAPRPLRQAAPEEAPPAAVKPQPAALSAEEKRRRVSAALGLTKKAG
jgi:hypothetical protein